MAVQITLEGQPPKYLTAPSYKLGRASDCDVLLPENDAMVSRYHARMERDTNGQWWIVDFSTNGTFVNGEKLNGRRALQSGDQVGIGRTQIGFLAPQSAAALSAAPVRATETVFVTQAELQAKIAQTSASPVAPPQPIAPLSPPVASVLPVSQPFTTLPETQIEPETVSSEVDGAASSTRTEHILDKVPLLESIFPATFEPAAKVSSPPSSLPAAPLVRVEAPSFETPLIVAVAASPVIDDGVMKQCTRCRNIYSQGEEECPACDHAGFKIKIKSIAAQTAMASISSVPVETTPFDQAIRRGAEPQQLAPAAPVARTIPNVSTVRNQQTSTAAKGMLDLIAAGCGAAMLFSLFLPWGQIQMFFVSGSVSYAQLCQMALQGASQSSDLTMRVIEQEPRILLFFLPALATLVTLGGGGISLIGAAGNLPPAVRSVPTGIVLGSGGALGLLASFLLFSNLGGSSSGMNLTNVLGLGFWLFALASLAAAVAGFGGGALKTAPSTK